MPRLIELMKENGPWLVIIGLLGWVLTLVLLSLVEAAVHDFPKIKKDPPKPPVYHGDHPRSDRTSCIVVDGLTICPRQNVPRIENNTSYHASNPMLKPGKVKAGRVIIPNMIGVIAFGETRYEAPQDVVRAVRLVANVLQTEWPIDVYVADFKRGPAAYTRRVGFEKKYEIVFSKRYAPQGNRGRIHYPFLGLVAHEVSHTIFNEGWGEDRMSNEASAEYQAGAAIFRIGGNLEDSFEFSSYFTGTSPVHPKPGLSAMLSREGWYDAKALHEGTAGVCAPRIVAEDFQYKDMTCKYILTCNRQKRPIRVACDSSNGHWEWQ